MGHAGGMTRRQLLLGGSAVLAGSVFVPAMAAESGTPVRLALRKRVIEVNHKAADVYSIEDPAGNRGKYGVVGERFFVEVVNELDSESLIHWHGLTPPNVFDGVPTLPGPPIAPGKSAVYDFPNLTAGTHWMHSHLGLQEQRMLAAPLIVRETEEPMFDAQEHVVMLHDFTFRDPQEILDELKHGGGLHAGHAMGGMGGAMGMPEKLNDVAFDAYLANDRTLDDPEVLRVEKGTRVRLRIINAAAASNMWIDTGALSVELIAVDGHTIKGIHGTRFPLAIAQRADLRFVIPAEGGAWPILFHPEGVAQRTGIVLATAGAPIAKLSVDGEIAPALDLELEAKLEAAAVLRKEPVTRTEIVMLTGGSADYSWGLNGKYSLHDTVFMVREGERVMVMMHNMTGMAHPMHLHGHYFRVVGIDGRKFLGALRDTVLVPPGQAVTIMFDAENPGTWAFHCHHLYHMNAGMMGTMAYARAA